MGQGSGLPNSKFTKKVNPKDFITQGNTNRNNYITKNKAKTSALAAAASK